MAQKRFVIDGYGQVELNNVAFRRDGRIEVQCALDAEDFKNVPCENGMLLAIDNVKHVVKFPDVSGDTKQVIGLVYTTEHMYDDRHNALKDFKTVPGEFYPRLGIITIGEKWTENCISYDPEVDTDWVDDDAVKEAIENLGDTPIYGGISADGSVLISATMPTVGPVLQAISRVHTMPDGQFGIQFQVIG